VLQELTNINKEAIINQSKAINELKEEIANHEELETEKVRSLTQLKDTITN